MTTKLNHKLSGNQYLDTPEPLQRAIPQSKPYPIEKLATEKDSRLAKAAKAISNVIQCPDGVAANSLLAAASLACQPLRDVEMDGRKKPLSLFLLTIGESGERKTAADDIALKMHRNHEVGLSIQNEDKLHQYKISIEAWKKSKAEAIRNANTMEERVEALSKLGKEPEPPLSPSLLIEEPTYEGLIKLLHEGQASIGLFSDEGGRFFGGHGMSSDNALKTAAGISKLYDDGSATRVRAGEGAIILKGKRLSMHLMMQGVVAEKVFGDRILLEQGLLARCLVAYPETKIGSRSYKSVRINELQEIIDYNKRIRELLRTEQPILEDTRNTLEPASLHLEPKAKELWIKFHDELDKLAATGGKLEPVRALAVKMPDHVLRIAGVLTVFENTQAEAITITTIANAIELANYYLGEALRIHGLSATDENLVIAQKTLDWLHSKNIDVFYLAMIYQKSPIRKLRNKNAASRIINILENHNWVRRLPEGTVVDGKKRRTAWVIMA